MSQASLEYPQDIESPSWWTGDRVLCHAVPLLSDIGFGSPLTGYRDRRYDETTSEVMSVLFTGIGISVP